MQTRVRILFWWFDGDTKKPRLANPCQPGHQPQEITLYAIAQAISSRFVYLSTQRRLINASLRPGSTVRLPTPCGGQRPDEQTSADDSWECSSAPGSRRGRGGPKRLAGWPIEVKPQGCGVRRSPRQSSVPASRCKWEGLSRLGVNYILTRIGVTLD